MLAETGSGTPRVRNEREETEEERVLINNIISKTTQNFPKEERTADSSCVTWKYLAVEAKSSPQNPGTN